MATSHEDRDMSDAQHPDSEPDPHSDTAPSRNKTQSTTLSGLWHENRRQFYISVVAIVAVLLAGGVGTYLWLTDYFHKDASIAEVGDCLRPATNWDRFELSDHSTHQEIRTVRHDSVVRTSCDSPDAVGKVVEVARDHERDFACEANPDSDFRALVGPSDNAVALCVRLLLKQGDCLDEDLLPASCDSSEARFAIAAVLTGTSDPDRCAAETRPRVYRGDDTVVCIASR